jgi:hypothetical protein
MKVIFKKFKKLKIFDWVLILIFLFLAIGFFAFFFRQSKPLTVRLKITEKNVLYINSTPPSWFVYLFKTGMSEKDGFGRVNAEVLDVYFYETAPAHKAVYLTLNLKTTYNGRSKEYKYKGNPVVVGESLRVNLDGVLAEGLIVGIEETEDQFGYDWLKVRTRLMENSFSETTGVEPFIAESVHIGDEVLDSTGELMAEILSKEVFPAQKNTFDDKGNVYQRSDPRKKDVFLTLKVRTRRINNEYYFFDDIQLKVGQMLPLNFANISVYPMVTNIEKIEE